MAGFPDWRDAAAYQALIGIDRAGLAWEWLRRDPAYRQAAGGRQTTIEVDRAGAFPILAQDAVAAAWGLHFRERPEQPAPQARLVWRSGFDRGVVAARAERTSPRDPDAVCLRRYAPWVTLVRDPAAGEHLVLSDGYHRIRVDIIEGSLLAGEAIRLHYILPGLAHLDIRLFTLRRLLGFWRHRRFLRALFPPSPDLPRRIEALRVGDARAAGASYRDIAIALVGEARVRAAWNGHPISLCRAFGVASPKRVKCRPGAIVCCCRPSLAPPPSGGAGADAGLRAAVFWAWPPATGVGGASG